MACIRLFSWGIHSKILFKNTFLPLLHKSSLKCQATLFHKDVTSQNSPAVKEHLNESDSELESNNQNVNDAALKLKLLHEGLKYVPEHGWTKYALALGAQSLGLSAASHSLIQDNGADLVHYFNFLCNENLIIYLKQQNSEIGKNISAQEFIENALEKRLRMVIPFASRWAEAMALMVSPGQLPDDLKNLFYLVDTIWSHSNSSSLNANWYSKRISLAIAYKLCEFNLVQDYSPDYAVTFQFLQRRVEAVLNTNEVISKLASTNQQLPNYGFGALLTMRNICGLNRLFR